MSNIKVGLLAVDSNYPNLALMKLNAYHKGVGDHVEWYNPLDRYDKVYMAKVFSYTPDYGYYINADEVVKGGTGYDLTTTLPKDVEYLQPDYSIYPSIDKKTAYGFLTRGCPNKCKWCVVPGKEGKVAPYMDIEEIAVDGRRNIILMDNNVLASDYGLQQIEKIAKMKLRVDFNQGLDARLITDDIAKLLASVRWIKEIRLACDKKAQIPYVIKAYELLKKYGYNRYIFCYFLIDDWDDAIARLDALRPCDWFKPHGQPYRDFNNPHQVIPQWQKDMAHWMDKHNIYFSTDFKDFSPRKGFKCSEYFKS